MNRMGVLAVLAAALLIGQSARAEDYRVARVSDVRGTLSVRGEDEEEASAVYTNSVFRAGDTVWSDSDTLAELELENGNWIRLSEDTKLEIRRLDATPELRLWNGSVYLDFDDGSGRGCLLRTPEADVQVAAESVVRVDLGSGSDARISVYSGEAEVIPDRGERARLRSSERAYLESGALRSEPERFNREDRDGFDDYNRERVDYFIDRPAPRELDRELIGVRDLREYGTWITIEQTRYWRPRCEPDWRPYSRGYWSVVPGWGYTWVDHQPWGFVTCHYGRWRWMPAHGWLWYPGYAWRPAWVRWSSWDTYIGWAPLDPWDRPCDTGAGLFLSVGFSVDDRSWTFCPRDRFYYGRHQWVLNRGRLPFYAGHEVRLDPKRFRPVDDADREIGIPRDHVRGSTVDKGGRLVRDRVLDLERRLPQKRLPEIRERYRAQPDQDRTRAQQPGNTERYQRPPFTPVDPGKILKGDDAERKIRRLPTTPVTPPVVRTQDQPFRRRAMPPAPSVPPRPPVPEPVRPRMETPRTPPTPRATPTPRTLPTPRTPATTPNRGIFTPRTAPGGGSGPAPKGNPRGGPR